MGFDPSRVNGAATIDLPPELNELTHAVIGAAMEVHSVLGPGLREKIYEIALEHEMRVRGLRVMRQQPFEASYKGTPLPVQVIDTVVNETLLVEIKSVARLCDEDHAQLIGYLNLTGLPLGLLLNFGAALLRNGIHRKINYPARNSRDVKLVKPLLPSVTSVSAL